MIDSPISGLAAGAGPLATPDFAISGPAQLRITQGSRATGTVFVDSLNGFNGTVTLVPSVLPSLLNGPNITLSPADVLVTAIASGTSTLLITTTTSTPLGSYNYTITGTAAIGVPTLVESFKGQIIILAVTPPNFTMTSIPGNQTVVTGTSATSAIVLTSLFGFSGNVTLTTSSPPACPTCPTWSINPSLVALHADSGNAVLNFTSALGSIAGAYTVNVTGTSGGLSHSILVGFVVIASIDFSITPSSTSLVLAPGQVTQVSITIASLNGFSGTVGLQTSTPPISCPPPACTTWSLAPTSVFLTSGGTVAATLTVQAGILGGSGNITVTGTSGTLSHSTLIQYSSMPSPDFALTVTPSNLILTTGSSGTSTITVVPLNGFNSIVIFSLTTSQGLLAIIIPRNLTGSGTATLFLNAAAPGNCTTVVTGASGSLIHSVAILVTVKAPPPPPPSPCHPGDNGHGHRHRHRNRIVGLDPLAFVTARLGSLTNDIAIVTVCKAASSGSSSLVPVADIARGYAILSLFAAGLGGLSVKSNSLKGAIGRLIRRPRRAGEIGRAIAIAHE